MTHAADNPFDAIPMERLPPPSQPERQPWVLTCVLVELAYMCTSQRQLNRWLADHKTTIRWLEKHHATYYGAARRAISAYRDTLPPEPPPEQHAP
ncbi:hypothetical protein [Ferrovibrio sp.]|uniref:hypothetical protein n=1 Tax=Ferrovibrio sp. TaxID=1917215 RepID=UPI003D11AE96